MTQTPNRARTVADGPVPVRAIVTGGAGFIGSRLAAVLADRGVRVLVVDDLSSGIRDRVPPAAELEVLDIAASDLAPAFARWRPDVVFHLAAQTRVPASEADPQRDLEVNVIGTRRVLDAARAAGRPFVVFVSSGGAVYGETVGAATERTAPRPDSYYGIHKLTGEHYTRHAGLPAAIVRPANIFGPGQPRGLDGAVVPAFVGAALAGTPFTIHGDGLQVRDFLFRDDMVDALVTVADRRLAGTWNVATGHGTTILELAAAVAAAAGRDPGHLHEPRRRGDVRRSVLSAERLSRAGWTPRVSLEDGLRQVVEGATRPATGA